eukprot:gene46793-62603_t
MKNIFDYLVTQPGETIDNLYGARDGPSTHATADHNMAIDQLINLRIFLGDASSIEKISENRHFRLNKFFQRSIKHALCHPTEPWSSMAIVPHIAEEYAPS